MDIVEADHFRWGVLRREVTADITYSKQRDHFAHTLYNYILGWYFFCYCKPISEAFKKHLEIRMLDPYQLEDCFLSSWIYVSLLHDIGYLFEGSISPLSTATQSEHARRGALVVQDFFQHRLWTSWKIDSPQGRDTLRAISGTDDPKIDSGTLAGIADSLRRLGNLDKLRNCAYKEIAKKHDPSTIADILRIGPLPQDAFYLWEAHYRSVGQDSMAKRIKWLSQVFDHLLYKGIGGSGLRVLDHGVCGGMILLLYSTNYYSTYFGLDITPPSDPFEKHIWTEFRNTVTSTKAETDPYWWWSGLVWATAACALHNAQQMNLNEFCDLPVETQLSESEFRLKLEEDPLAYLGILVDCVQEWDRFTTAQESIIGGELPLQSLDVSLRHKDDKVFLALPEKFRKKAEAALDRSLAGWKNYLALSR